MYTFPRLYDAKLFSLIADISFRNFQDLEKNGVRILGTAPSVIDLAEDRDQFRAMMDKLEIPMPEAGMATTVEEAVEIAGKIGFSFS